MSSALPANRVTAWDGLRGVACILVLGFHCGLIPGGAVGVDVFFVLSGFLITDLLARETARDGGISLSRFFARRAYRLLPALGVLLLVALFASSFIEPTHLLGPLGRAATAWVLFFSANWAAVTTGRSLGVLQPTWSLAVEEQFYLLWAPLFALWATSKLRRHALTKLVLALAAASLVWRVLHLVESSGIYGESREFYREYVALDARAYALLLGAAWALAAGSTALRRVREQAQWLAAAATLTLLAVAGVYDFHRETGVGLLAPPCALLLVQAGGDGNGFVAKLLALPPFVWLGRISYSLYLWHVAAFAIVAPESAVDPYRYPPSWLQLAGMLGLALALGYLSYRFVERPALAFRARWERRIIARPEPAGAK
jgi:peptidoglycan/LPS O-acetylase OafA/YrhL